MNLRIGDVEITNVSVEDLIDLKKKGFIGVAKETNTPVPVIKQNVSTKTVFVRPDVDSYKTKYETVDALKNVVASLEHKNKVHCSPTNNNYNPDYKKWNDESFKYCDKYIKTYPKGSENRKWLTWCHRFEYFKQKSMRVPVVVKTGHSNSYSKKEPQGVGSDHVIAAHKNGSL